MPEIRVEAGDCMDVMARMVAAGERVHSIVTDPPYHLTSIVKRFGGEGAKAPKPKSGPAGAYSRSARGFMGKQWDGGDIAFRPDVWRLCWELLPPGGWLLAFSATRTYHRMACAVEDAGFEIRDMFAWLYGSGFPKSYDAERAVAMAKCELPGRHYSRNLPDAVERQEGDHLCPSSPESLEWSGWGTAPKPAFEPVVFARKPMVGSLGDNLIAHGAGGLNIDGCRIEHGEALGDEREGAAIDTRGEGWGFKRTARDPELGRWPANVVHDGSDEVVALFPETTSGARAAGNYGVLGGDVYRKAGIGPMPALDGSSGSAARFFYSAKADATDRCGSKHPTVKPTDLMAWLLRLVTPPGGTVLDPFAGSGSTGMAAMREGFAAVLIEREAEYLADINRRLAHVSGADTPLLGGCAA